MPNWTGSTSNKIFEIELNFSNICGANCIICSRFHGVSNIPFMNKDVFNELIVQLKDVDFEMIQTSGNGEAFLNPNYLDYITTIKEVFPTKPRWTYNNFSLFDKERADRVVKYKLFDKVHIRIDSLEPWVFERNSNLNQNLVFENLKYFLSINKDISVVLLYNNINDYYQRCTEVIGKRPLRDAFTDAELSSVRDEERDIKDYFQRYSALPIDVCRIGHSLWGERTQAPKDIVSKCPKFNIIKNITWICPDGSVETCCYSDKQRDFVAGNIMSQHLLDIFYSKERSDLLKKIENREITEYPCINPKCCEFQTERKL